MQPDRSTPEHAPPAPSRIHVALVEDDVHFQNALMAAIRTAPDMALLGVANTRAAGLRMVDTTPAGAMRADVLLVDLGLPDGSGIDVIRAALVQWPACSIMVCTTFGDEAHVMQSIEAGASGYLLKDSAPEHLLQEIRSLHAGGSPISPLIARQILRRFQPSHGPTAPVQRPDTKDRGCVLSTREAEVLGLITKGFASHEIAKLLSVSQHTVLTYVRRIYAKLEVKSRAEAIYEARNQGLLAQ